MCVTWKRSYNTYVCINKYYTCGHNMFIKWYCDALSSSLQQQHAKWCLSYVLMICILKHGSGNLEVRGTGSWQQLNYVITYLDTFVLQKTTGKNLGHVLCCHLVPSPMLGCSPKLGHVLFSQSYIHGRIIIHEC